MKIGYIGLGFMGGALARRLVGAHELTVWDLNTAATTAFQELGVAVAASAAELARNSDIVLLCLPRTSDVRTLCFAPGGLVEGLSPGKLVIDQTSGVPGETRAIAEQLASAGITLIDAPVSGGVAGANAGTITIMVSAPEESFQRALPVLQAISPNVLRCGNKVGDAQAMKSVNNLLSAGCRMSTFEVVAMGRKLGLSLPALTEALNKGSGRNRTVMNTLPILAKGTPAPLNFAMALMLKDMNQAMQLGMACGVPMTLTNLVRGLLQSGVNTFGKDAQYEKVVDLVETMAGTSIMDLAGAEAAAAGFTAKPSLDAKQARIGYVGLGAMGGALVRRLIPGHKITVFDSRKEAVAAFEAEGAVGAKDLASLARDCDIVFVCLPTSAIVREVIFGPGGLAEGLSPGKIVVDQTTGDPAVTRGIAADLQKLGVSLVDAPVAGGPRGAVAGTLAILCGGPAEAFASVRPLFDQISPNSVYCGVSGNGHIAKLVNNALATCNVLLTYEAASLAVKYGLKLADVAKVINLSTGASAASERILPSLSEGRDTADFKLQLMLKDLKLVQRLAMDCGVPMLISNAVCNLYEAGTHQVGPTANIDAMARYFESAGNLQFVGA